MNGELAQLICLATYGSAWLAAGGRQELPALDRDRGEHVGNVAMRQPNWPLRASGWQATFAPRSRFAVRQDLPEWAGRSDRVLAGGGSIPVHPHMLPSGGPEGQRRLAALAAHAWFSVAWARGTA